MVDRLTEKEAKECRKVFDQYKKRNGDVEYQHLETMLNQLKHYPTELEMESIYEHLDIYGNGSVCFPHFLAMVGDRFSRDELANKVKLRREEEDDLHEEMREAFKVFDGDGNGFISQAELKHTLINMGETLSEEEIEEMMHEADRDGDGQISFPEFCRLMTIQEEQDNPKMASRPSFARISEMAELAEMQESD